MNHFYAGTHPARCGGFMAMVRVASDGAIKPLLGERGRPRIFPEEIDALRAATDNLVAYINGHLVREGEIAGETVKAIEQNFRVVKQRAKSKVISVTYKRGKANGGSR